MITLLEIAALVCFLSLAAFLVLQAKIALKKNSVETGLSIQCSSGDSEVMIFNANLMDGDSEETKQKKIADAFRHIENRRTMNHAKYLEVKAAAIAENMAKVEDGEDLKLHSITEAPKGKVK